MSGEHPAAPPDRRFPGRARPAQPARTSRAEPSTPAAAPTASTGMTRNAACTPTASDSVATPNGPRPEAMPTPTDSTATARSGWPPDAVMDMDAPSGYWPPRPKPRISRPATDSAAEADSQANDHPATVTATP